MSEDLSSCDASFQNTVTKLPDYNTVNIFMYENCTFKRPSQILVLCFMNDIFVLFMYVHMCLYLSVTTCVHAHSELQFFASRIFYTVFLKLKPELIFKHELKHSHFPRLQHLVLFLRKSNDGLGQG